MLFRTRRASKALDSRSRFADCGDREGRTRSKRGNGAYNGIHCWLAQTDHDKRLGWVASVDKTAALKPKIVVAGHKDPNTRGDDATAILDATRTYIQDFDRLVTKCTTPAELIDEMMKLHGERGNPYTLWTAAYGVSQQLQR